MITKETKSSLRDIVNVLFNNSVPKKELVSEVEKIYDDLQTEHTHRELARKFDMAVGLAMQEYLEKKYGNAAKNNYGIQDYKESAAAFRETLDNSMVELIDLGKQGYTKVDTVPKNSVKSDDDIIAEWARRV